MITDGRKIYYQNIPLRDFWFPFLQLKSIQYHSIPGMYTWYKKPPKILCDVRRGLTTRHSVAGSQSPSTESRDTRPRRMQEVNSLHFETNTILWALHTIQPSRYYIENNYRFEGFCELWFSSRPTYLRFRCYLLAVCQNTNRSKQPYW